MGEAEALAQARHAGRVDVELEAGRELGHAAEIAAREDRADLAEVVLEAGGRDDLDDLAGRVAGVPEGVPLVARLEDPGARAGAHDLVAEERAERAGEYVGVLVLAVVAVQGRGERP